MVVLDVLPKNAVGKIAKPEVNARLKEIKKLLLAL